MLTFVGIDAGYLCTCVSAFPPFSYESSFLFFYVVVSIIQERQIMPHPPPFFFFFFLYLLLLCSTPSSAIGGEARERERERERDFLLWAFARTRFSRVFFRTTELKRKTRTHELIIIHLAFLEICVGFSGRFISMIVSQLRHENVTNCA